MSHLDAPMFPAVPVTGDPTAGRTDDHGAVVPAVSLRRIDTADSDVTPHAPTEGPVIEFSAAWPPRQGEPPAGIGVHLDETAARVLADVLTAPTDTGQTVTAWTETGEGAVRVARASTGHLQLTFAPPRRAPRSFLAWPHEARLIAGHLTRLAAA